MSQNETLASPGTDGNDCGTSLAPPIDQAVQVTGVAGPEVDVPPRVTTVRLPHPRSMGRQTMWWHSRRARRRAAEQARWDGHVGAYRLRGGDVVPLANGKRWTDYLRTQELPIIDQSLLTPGGEHRSGKRRWLP